jgi:hypothetical protein
MQWSQLALLLAARLAARRERLDRLAWSNDEHAARVHDLAELREAIEPAVRAMTTDEIAHWPTSDSHRTPETAGPVSAEVALVHDRWALHATAHHDDTTVGHVWVSCRDETLARDLAQEIVASGQPETVYRLGAHVALAEQADAHRAQVQASAPPTDRQAMAAHVQSAWSPEVAAAPGAWDATRLSAGGAWLPRLCLRFCLWVGPAVPGRLRRSPGADLP